MYPRRLDSFRKIWNPHTYQHWHHWYVRVIYFHLRATSTCNRVVFSPISASPGQNYNFAKNIFKSLSPLFPHRCHHHPFPIPVSTSKVQHGFNAMSSRYPENQFPYFRSLPCTFPGSTNLHILTKPFLSAFQTFSCQFSSDNLPRSNLFMDR